MDTFFLYVTGTDDTLPFCTRLADLALHPQNRHPQFLTVKYTTSHIREMDDSLSLLPLKAL